MEYISNSPETTEKIGEEIYNTYIDYLSEYKNNEIADKDGEKQKTKYVYLRMIKAEGVEKPIMMVEALNEKLLILYEEWESLQ